MSPSLVRRTRKAARIRERAMLTCAMSWESFSHGLAPALSSPLRKTAPYGRPVHRLGDRAGRSPGSRVVAQLRPAFPVSQWPYGRGLAADSCGGSHGLLRIRKARTGRFRVPSFVPGFCPGNQHAEMFHPAKRQVKRHGARRENRLRQSKIYSRQRTNFQSRNVFPVARRFGISWRHYRPLGEPRL